MTYEVATEGGWGCSDDVVDVMTPAADGLCLDDADVDAEATGVPDGDDGDFGRTEGSEGAEAWKFARGPRDNFSEGGRSSTRVISTSASGSSTFIGSDLTITCWVFGGG